MDISHLKQKFIEEANDLLSGLEGDLLELEKESSSKQLIDQIFRKLHTIKGASGMFGYENIMEITHHLETVYDLIRNSKLKVTKHLIDMTFTIGDHIRSMLEDNENPSPANSNNHSALIQLVNQFTENSSKGTEVPKNIAFPASNKSKETWQILIYPDESLIHRGINLSFILSDLHQLGYCNILSNLEDNIITYWNIFIVTSKGKEAIEDALIFILDSCRINKIANYDIFNEQESIERKAQMENLEAEYADKAEIPYEKDTNELKVPVATITNELIRNKLQNSQRISVDSSKLDTLMYLVTELVTTKSELLLAIQNRSEIKMLEASEKVDKLSKLFSENALNIRLVSLQEMLIKYQRLIRDLSNTLGKKVQFSIEGGDTELDKNIVDIIAEPVMHLIRNCIDHGIELPEKRREKRKNETGVIFFNAFKSGNNVFIQVGDDGVGIDTDYVYNKAVDQNYIQLGTQLTQNEIFDLIFLPGFSTAQSLTEVSGRGVGMDIVRKKIHEIRGEIIIESTIGKGTTFTIKLQQTISIIDTLLIVSDGSTFALPIEDVELCDLEEHNNIFGNQSRLISFQGELIPFIYLREVFSSFSVAPEKEKLILINRQGKRFAIVTDEIVGQHQSVIKPLTKTFQNINFLSGASILGDGSIALLLDTDKLKYLANRP